MKQFLLLMSYAFIFTTMGMKIVLLPALFLKGGLSEAWIGAVFTLELFAGISIAAILPKLAKRIGVLYTYTGLLVVCAASAMGFVWSHGVLQWAMLSFVLGIGMMGAITLLQSLYNQVLDNHNRGWYLALSTIALCTGFTIGPIIVGLVKGSLFWGLSIAALCALLGVLPVWGLHQKQEAPPLNRPVKWMYFLKREPVVFLGGFCREFAVAALFALGVVYLVGRGHSVVAAGYSLSAFAASAIVDLIVGKWIDRYSPTRIAQIGSVGFALSLFGLVFWAEFFLVMLGLFFAMGVFTGMMYLSLSTLLNNCFPKKTLVSANAAVQLAGNLGGIAGAIVAGLVMQLSIGFFPIVLMVVLLGFFVGSLLL